MSIHHRDILDLETLDAARHQMNDPIYLGLRECLPVPQRHDNRRPRPIFFIGEQAPLRSGEVNASSFNLRHLGNRPSQFALQCATIIEFLNEI